LRTFGGYFSYPEISCDEIDAGAPFFLADGDGSGAAVGVALGVCVGEGWGLGEGVAEFGVGDAEDFFFFRGEGLGEAFFFFGEGDGLASDFLGGDGDSSGVALASGEGDFSASSLFFAVVDFLRCFRGVGVGVGAKIFLNLSPNEFSAACWRGAIAHSSANATNAPMIFRVRCIERLEPSYFFANSDKTALFS